MSFHPLARVGQLCSCVELPHPAHCTPNPVGVPCSGHRTRSSLCHTAVSLARRLCSSDFSYLAHRIKSTGSRGVGGF